MKIQTPPSKNIVEGYTIATPTNYYNELLDISANAGSYARVFQEMNRPKYQFNPNNANIYDPNHPEYVPNVKEAVLMDTYDVMNYQTTILGISSVALISVIIGTIMYSSNRG